MTFQRYLQDSPWSLRLDITTSIVDIGSTETQVDLLASTSLCPISGISANLSVQMLTMVLSSSVTQGVNGNFLLALIPLFFFCL